VKPDVIGWVAGPNSCFTICIQFLVFGGLNSKGVLAFYLDIHIWLLEFHEEKAALLGARVSILASVAAAARKNSNLR